MLVTVLTEIEVAGCLRKWGVAVLWGDFRSALRRKLPSERAELAHMIRKSAWQSGRKADRILWLPGSRGALLIARQIARVLAFLFFFFFLAFALLMGALPRNLLFWRARGAAEVTVQARELQEEVVTRDIWLPGCCARLCAVKGARGLFKSRHGLRIKREKSQIVVHFISVNLARRVIQTQST